MSQPAPDTLVLNLVVCGASRSGKSMLLRGIHERLGTGSGGAPSAVPHNVMPLDWVSLDLGTIGGRPATVLLYAMPGVVAFDATRRVLLHRADGVIFIADLQAARLDDNLAAHAALFEHLEARTSPALPIAYFYSKQDLPSELLVATAVLDAAFGVGSSPRSAGDAVRGDGVREVLQAVLTLMLRRVSGRDAVDA